MTYYIIGILALLIIGAGVYSYNKLVGYRELVDNAFSQIAVQVESRWDQVSSLIKAAKSYEKYESETLENITKARAYITKNSSVDAIEQDSLEFEGTLARLIALAENYPDLKASGPYRDAMAAIGTSEDKIRYARMIYNDSVTKLNRAIKVFPTVLYAGLLGFRERDYFQGSPDKEEMPSWD